MEKILKPYQMLLDVYTEQVKGLEEEKKKLAVKHSIDWIPHMVLNSRMFTYDEHLTNIHHGGLCFNEKNRIMPHLVNFLAAFEKCSDEEKTSFENLKTKNEYQQHLDELYVGKGKFLEFLQAQLKELREREYRCRIPSRPQRSNATRQQAKYREDMKAYEEEIASINRCRDEVNKRIQLYNELIKS